MADYFRHPGLGVLVQLPVRSKLPPVHFLSQIPHVIGSGGDYSSARFESFSACHPALHYLKCRYMHTRGQTDLEPFLRQGLPYLNGVPLVPLCVIPTITLKKPHE
jgi:hypothetical protein